MSELPRKKKGLALVQGDRVKEIAKLGGIAVSKNREHMSEIGRKGGLRVSQDLRHMAEIGSKGGKKSKRVKK